MELIRKRAVVRLLLAAAVAAGVHAQSIVSPGPAKSSDAAPATTKKTSPDERVVIKVGNVGITQAEFESRISAFEAPGGEGESAVPTKTRRDLGDDYASVLMLSQQAVADHLDTTPEVRRALEIARIQTLSDAEFARLLRQAQPTPEEISAYYSAHISDYDQVQVRRLFIWKKGEGSSNANGLSPQEARARADKIVQTNATGGDPQKLIEQFKNSPDGLLDAAPVTFPRGELPPRLEKVAFSLKEGEWGQAEDTPSSILLFHLVKRSHRQLGEVSSLIERKVQGQKMQATLDDLKKKAGIWMDMEYFATPEAPSRTAKAPASSPPPTRQESPSQEEKNNADEKQN